MADNNEQQWFEQNDPRPKAGQTGRKKPSQNGKAGVNNARKQGSGQRKTVQAGSGATGRQPVKGQQNSSQRKGTSQQQQQRRQGTQQQVQQKKQAEQKKQAQQIKQAQQTRQTQQPKPQAVNPTPNEIRKKSSRRKALVNSAVAAALVLLGLAVLLFVVHHLFDYFAVKPNLEFITEGSIEHTIGSRAIVVRDESVVSSTFGGDFVTEAAEGSRVASGQAIAMVIPSEMATVLENLRNTQSQISDVQQELIAEGEAEGADVIYNDIDESLTPVINMLRIDAIDGNLSALTSYSSSISVLLNKRELELAELDFDDERLRVLRSDEAGYESQLQARASVVTATEPGIVSFKLDGLETELTYEVLLNAEASIIREYINNATGVITSDLTVAAGDNIARIAKNDEQYIACFLNQSDADIEAFEVGTQHTIIVGSEGLSIGKCIVERIAYEEDGDYLVVFSTTRYVEDLLDVRSADIEVVITETEGMRVPVTSLVNADYDRGFASIYINNQGFCTEINVLIVDYDREFAIIKPTDDSGVPNTQTVYITNPESVSPGDQVA